MGIFVFCTLVFIGSCNFLLSCLPFVCHSLLILTHTHIHTHAHAHSVVYFTHGLQWPAEAKFHCSGIYEIFLCIGGLNEVSDPAEKFSAACWTFLHVFSSFLQSRRQYKNFTLAESSRNGFFCLQENGLSLSAKSKKKFQLTEVNDG